MVSDFPRLRNCVSKFETNHSFRIKIKLSNCKADKFLLVNRLALETVDRFTDSLDLTDFASRIIHPLVRTLDGTPELRKTAMDTLCSLVQQLNRRYQTFIPMVQQVIVKHRIVNQRYDILMCHIIKVRGVET